MGRRDDRRWSNAVCFILVILMDILPVRGADPMLVNKNRTLPLHAKTQSISNIELCECRARCYISLTCKGMAFEISPSLGNSCFLTNVPVRSYHLIEQQSAVTLLKQSENDKICSSPFQWVPWVGCIFLHIQPMMTFSRLDTQMDCRSSFGELFIAESGRHLVNLWGFIEGLIPTGMSWYFYVGAFKGKWDSGRNVTEWAPNQPTGNYVTEPCVYVGPLGLIFDGTCMGVASGFVCQKRTIW